MQKILQKPPNIQNSRFQKKLQYIALLIFIRTVIWGIWRIGDFGEQFIEALLKAPTAIHYNLINMNRILTWIKPLEMPHVPIHIDQVRIDSSWGLRKRF